MSSEPMPMDVAVQRVTFQLKGSSLSDPTLDPEIRWAIDSTLKDMVTRTQYAAFKKDADPFTMAAGDETFTFPEDFVQLIDKTLRMTEEPNRTLIWKSEIDFHRWEYERQTTTGEPFYYFIKGKEQSDGLYRCRVWPTPTEATEFIYSYISMPESCWNTLTGGGHILDRRFPSQFFQQLIWGTCLSFPQYLDQVTLADFAGKYESAIKSMANKSEPLVGNTMQKESYTGSGGGRGWWSGKIWGR